MYSNTHGVQELAGFVNLMRERLAKLGAGSSTRSMPPLVEESCSAEALVASNVVCVVFVVVVVFPVIVVFVVFVVIVVFVVFVVIVVFEVIFVCVVSIISSNS